MFAGELINPVIAPVKLSNAVQKVLARMAEFHLRQLPVVDGSQCIGLVSEESLLDIPNQQQQLKELHIPLHQIFLYENQHAYEALKVMHEQKLSAIPVLNQDKKYLGMIDTSQLINGISKLTSVESSGSIVVLEISNRDNSLAHIAQIVEADHTQILSSYVQTFPDSTRLELTLKLNRTEIASIISAFQRYDYTVLAVFNELKVHDDYHSRYDQLMNYLDL